MTFAGVIEALKSGKRVTRKQWGANVWMAVFEDHFIQAASDHASYNYDLSWFEIDADDWEVV